MLDSTNSSRISAEFVARARCSKTTSGGSALVAALAVWCASVALLPSFASAQTGGCSRPPRSLVQRFEELDCALNCGDGWKNEINEDRKLAWKESYLMMAYLAMYDATLDVYYLRKLVDHADSVLLSTDEMRGVTDYTGVSGPCWRDHFDSDGDGVADAYACWVVHSGMITYPMVRFAAIVMNSAPSLQSMLAWDGLELQYKANHYITEVQRTMDHHELEWFDDAPLTGTGHYRFPIDFPRQDLQGWNAPWNYQHAMGRTLLALADALEAINDPVGALFYRDKATKLATLFTLTTPVKFLCADGNGSYVWNYANYGHCSTICAETCSGSSHCPGIAGTHTRDISHAAIDVDFAAVAYSYGVVFSEGDMDRFAATYLKNIVKNDPLWDEVWDSVDGCPLAHDDSLQVGRWLNLSPWDDNEGIYLSVQAIYDDVFIVPSDPDVFGEGWGLLAAANLARWEGAFKMYGVNTGPGSGSNWADVTAADLNNDGTDWIVGIRNFDEKLFVYDYDPTPGLASTDRIGGGLLNSYHPPDSFNLAAVTSGDFEDNGIEKVAVLAQNSAQNNNAWIYFLEYMEGAEDFDPVGDTSMGGSGSGYAGIGAGVFQSNEGTWAAVVRNYDDRFSLFKFTFALSSVRATLQGSHFYFPQKDYQWADLAVGDFDGDGLAEIAAIGNGNNNAILVVLEWNGSALVEVARKTSFGAASDLAAVTAADLDGDGVDEIIMARNFDGTVRRYDLVLDQGQYTIIQSDNAVPYGASKSWGGLAGGRFSPSSNDELFIGMSNRTGDVHLYGVPGDCPWDLDCDGTVGVKDQLILQGAWGPCPVKGPCQMPSPCVPDSLGPCAADFDGDGTVGVADFLALQANWGACP